MSEPFEPWPDTQIQSQITQKDHDDHTLVRQYGRGMRISRQSSPLTNNTFHWHRGR